MSDIFGLIGNILKTIWAALCLIFKFIKFIFAKIWYFILAFIALIIGIFTFKKIKEKDD